MKMTWVLALSALLCSAPASAKDKGNNEYQSGSLFRAGFKEKQLSSNHWKIEANSKERNRDKALTLALYRAAILANASGYKFIEVTDGEVGVITLYYTVILQNWAKLEVVATNAAADVLSCKAHKSFKPLCRQYDVAQLIAETQDLLERTPEQRSNDLRLTAR